MLSTLTVLLKPATYLALGLAIGVISVLVGLDGHSVIEAGLCASLSVISAGFLVGATILETRR